MLIKYWKKLTIEYCWHCWLLNFGHGLQNDELNGHLNIQCTMETIHCIVETITGIPERSSTSSMIWRLWKGGPVDNLNRVHSRDHNNEVRGSSVHYMSEHQSGHCSEALLSSAARSGTAGFHFK